MGRTSLAGGYSLAYLQDISLTGLQRLAKVHELDPNMEVDELIQELRCESDDENDERVDDGSGFFSRVEGEEDEEDEDDDADYASDENEEDEEDADEAAEAASKEEAVATAPVEITAKADQKEQAKPVQDGPAPPAFSVTFPASHLAVKPWTAAPFVPAKSERQLTLAQPFAVGQPLSARGERGASASLKSLEVAARKREEDLRKARASEARREAAASRRERISTAFTSAQANSLGGLQRINNKPRTAAWDDAEKLAVSKRTDATQGQTTRRQEAVSSARDTSCE